MKKIELPHTEVDEDEKERMGRIVGFFHGLGLVKTREERMAIGRQKELEVKRKEGKIKSEEEFRELEKQIMELGDIFGVKKEKIEAPKEKEAEEKPEKSGLFSNLFEKKEKRIKVEEHKEEKEEIKSIGEELERSLKGLGNVLAQKKEAPKGEKLKIKKEPRN